MGIGTKGLDLCNLFNEGNFIDSNKWKDEYGVRFF